MPKTYEQSVEEIIAHPMRTSEEKAAELDKLRNQVQSASGKKKLTAQERRNIPSKDFALPGGKFPIHDEIHARQALRMARHAGSRAGEVRNAVYKRYPHMRPGSASTKQTLSEDLTGQLHTDAGRQAPRRSAPQSNRYRRATNSRRRVLPSQVRAEFIGDISAHLIQNPDVVRMAFRDRGSPGAHAGAAAKARKNR